MADLKSPDNSPHETDPRHVAIIMDGNGRWARQRNLPRNEGHRQGVDNVRRIVRAARDEGVRFLTLYAFSAENWNRPKAEVSALMLLLESFLRSQTKDLHDNRIRLRVLGARDALPAGVRKLLQKTEEATAHYPEATLTLALNYGSRQEVVAAVKRYAEAVQSGEADPNELDWDNFSQYLQTAPDLPDPDLIIRTSGEWRTSNFLLLQGAYTEFYFSPKYWPDFGEADFAEALADYRRRERRFGKTGEQIREEIT